MLTFRRSGSMFCLELLKIFLICFIFRCFLVLGHFCIVFLFCDGGLPLTLFSSFRRQYLPAFADDFGNLCEGHFLSFERFSNLYTGISS